MRFNPLSLTEKLKNKKGGEGKSNTLKKTPNLLQAIQCDTEALNDSKANFWKINLEKLQVPLKEAFHTHKELNRIDMLKTLKETQQGQVITSKISTLGNKFKYMLICHMRLLTELFQKYKKKGNPV